MTYYTTDGKPVEQQSDFNLTEISDVQEKINSLGKPYLRFVFKKTFKNKTIEFSKPMFEKIYRTNTTIYSKLEQLFELDRKPKINKDDFIGRKICINDKIDPEAPTRKSNDGRKTYDNYVIWDVYLPEVGPSRSNSEYDALCDEFGYTPPYKEKDVSKGDGFDDTPKDEQTTAEDIPF